MGDLFQKPKSKKSLLLEFIKENYYAKSSDVAKWGVRNYYNEPNRLARLLCEEGRIKRVSKEEKLFRFHPTHEDIWEFVK